MDKNLRFMLKQAAASLNDHLAAAAANGRKPRVTMKALVSELSKVPGFSGALDPDGGLRKPAARYLRQQAKDSYHRGGAIEVDENAALSVGDDPGCYVLGWLWVDDEKGVLGNGKAA